MARFWGEKNRTRRVTGALTSSQLSCPWERDGNVGKHVLRYKKTDATDSKSSLLPPVFLSHLQEKKRKKKTLQFNLDIVVFFCLTS